MNHDASIAVVEADSKLPVFCVAEERFSRIKGHAGFPYLSLREASKLYQLSNVTDVVIGSHSNFTVFDQAAVYDCFNDRNVQPFGFIPGNEKGKHKRFPGFLEMLKMSKIPTDPNKRKVWVENEIKFFFREFNSSPRVHFIGHHEAHAASAFYTSELQDSLVITLDGSGDDLSGAVYSFESGRKKKTIMEVSHLDSIGLVYSAVTERYNFRPSRHEGKITGLSAFGTLDRSYEILNEYVTIKNGIPKIRIARTRFKRILTRLKNRLSAKLGLPLSLSDLVERAAEASSGYANLASGIQKVTEDTVENLAKFWLNSTSHKNLCVAGGLFSNVKVNQRLSNLLEIEKFHVFPDMGDSGLALGGALGFLHQNTGPYNPMKLKEMSLGPVSQELSFIPESIVRKAFNWEIESALLASELLEQKTLGVVIGRMESGPRALCNRSILASPLDQNLNDVLNKKLNRTEFMPFAPVALDKYFEEIFQIPKSGVVSNYSFMTLACNVRNVWKSKLPASTHIDGTARPQLLTRDDNWRIYGLIEEFYKLTGVPALINTSFNAHEEPIILNLESALKVLTSGAVDIVLDENYIYRRKY
jgi:carbamoyltransferase